MSLNYNYYNKKYFISFCPHKINIREQVFLTQLKENLNFHITYFYTLVTDRYLVQGTYNKE